jgi:hypothetical protein
MDPWKNIHDALSARRAARIWGATEIAGLTERLKYSSD